MTNNRIAGIFLSITGSLVVIYSFYNFRIGTLQKIGPGWYPMIVGAFLLCLGILLGISKNKKNYTFSTFPNTKIKSFFLIVLTMPLFAFTVNYFGLILSIFLFVFINSFLWSGQKIKSRITLSLFFTLITVILFSLILNLNINLLPIIF